MRFFAVAAAIAGISLSSTFAAADETTRTVTSGIWVEINHHETWNRDCSQGPLAQIDITQKPSNGSLDVQIRDHVVEYNGSGGSTNCIGHTIQGVSVRYKANKSFKGTDTFIYDGNYSDKRKFTHSYTIIVK